MEMLVLIAVPGDLLRIGLRAVFETHPSVSNVIEVTTGAELFASLETHLPDRIVIHQSLIATVVRQARGDGLVIVKRRGIVKVMRVCTYR